MPEETVLPDDAVVIRGGAMASLNALREAAEDHFAFSETEREEGEYGVSVFCMPNCTAHEIATQLPPGKLPHRLFRQTTVGKLRDIGHDGVSSFGPGHATLQFGDLPTDADWERLQATFSDPEENPVAL